MLPQHRLVARLETADRFSLPEAADIFFITPFFNHFETKET
jgi:hypothetical protein